MLSIQQKRKLKELADRIRFTSEIRDSMYETTKQATFEIEDLLKMFDASLKPRVVSSTELATLFYNTQLEEILNDLINDNTHNEKEFRNFKDDKNRKDSTDENEERLSSQDHQIPDWVSHLRKEISKKCHPDAISRLNLSALEAFRRSEYLTLMNDAFLDKNWNEILLIGIFLDIWVNEIPPEGQKSRLSKCFHNVNSEVSEIKKSISYRWSEEWGNTELKYQVVELYTKKKGIALPEKSEVMKIIKEFEEKYSI